VSAAVDSGQDAGRRLRAARDVAPIALKLAGNAVRYRYLRRSGRAARPQAASIEITQRCIARCTMCGIWSAPPAPELRLEGWVELLAHPLLADLRELDVTGGEPFLREDLPELMSHVARLTRSNLGRLRSVAITTNALLTGIVVPRVEQITAELGRSGLDLVVVCALDGVGDVHDTVRNVPGAWSRLEQTLEGLRSLRARYDNLIVGLKTTIVPANVSQLDLIAEYAEANGHFTIVSPFIVTAGRYRNADLADTLAFGEDDVAAMLRFYRTRGGGWDYHREAMIAYLETGRTRRPCSCGLNYLFVRSTGRVLLCPLSGIDVGDLKDGSIGDIWTSRASRRLRRGIGHFPECGRCTEPGLERYALPFEGRAYLSLLPRLGPERFLAAHRHMGLDKYL
jgi:MoaA/NifB/PqqE/SkfB family radical SAM enzyme